MKRVLALLALVWAGLAAPGIAQAQVSLSHSPSTSPTLGSTIRGASATTFSISTSGSVTRLSGDAIRVSNSSVTTPTITIYCGLLNLCNLRSMRVTITPVPGHGAPEITKLRVGSLSGTTYASGSAPAEGASLVFDLAPIGLKSSASFRLGMDVILPANSPSGGQTFGYVVTVQLL